MVILPRIHIGGIIESKRGELEGAKKEKYLICPEANTPTIINKNDVRSLAYLTNDVIYDNSVTLKFIFQC